MKFTVNSTDLLSRLQIVSRVIAPKSTLPILEDVLFDIADGKLTLTASDLDTTLVTTMDLPSADADIKVAISSKMLLETVREFSDQPLEFNINDNNFAIIIKTASGSYNLVGQNGAEYPALRFAVLLCLQGADQGRKDPGPHPHRDLHYCAMYPVICCMILEKGSHLAVRSFWFRKIRPSCGSSSCPW